jgi:hypothetical protein
LSFGRIITASKTLIIIKNFLLCLTHNRDSKEKVIHLKEVLLQWIRKNKEQLQVKVAEPLMSQVTHMSLLPRRLGKPGAKAVRRAVEIAAVIRKVSKFPVVFSVKKVPL